MNSIVETRMYKIESVFKHLFFYVDSKGIIYLDWNDCPKYDFFDVKKRKELNI